MQNPIDGVLEELNEKQMAHLDEIERTKREFTGMTFKDGSPVPPNVARFSVGEIVSLHGGAFRIRKITKRDLILRGIPSK